MADEPNKYTTAWFAQQLTGQSHQLNRLAAEYKSQYELIVELRQRVAALEAEKMDAMAKIGELEARIELMTERLKVRFAELTSHMKANGQ